ncbi:MAG: hypothetical protein JWO06_482 [Bacteroidota bacterium]|nr:hypothetical protein [Bacteroidota bacterium]
MKKLYFNLFSTFLLFTLSLSQIQAQHLAIVRVGDGSSALSSAAAPVFIEVRSTSGSVITTPVALPIAANGANRAFTLNGTATTEGAITLSVDGNYLSLAGYDAAPGTASVSTATNIDRVVARVDAAGNVNTSTVISATGAYNVNNIRGAVSVDGNSFWTSGLASANGGTYYVNYGTVNNAPIHISTDVVNTRNVNIFNGQLYVSAAVNSYHGLNTIGTGLSTTAGQTTTNLNAIDNDASSSPYAFYFLDMDPNTPGLDVVYVADERTTNLGGVLKYSLVSGTWVLNGSINSATSLRGLTAYQPCGTGPVHLYVTSETDIYTLNDSSGYNQAPTGTLSSIYTTPTNTKLRGIALMPGSIPAPVNATVGSVTNVSCFGLTDGTVTVNAQGGNPPYSYNWGSNNPNQLAPGTYVATVTDATGCTDTIQATVGSPTAVVANATPFAEPCYGASNGGIATTASGGVGGYTYSATDGINNVSSGNGQFGFLTAGTYYVEVDDANFCPAYDTVTITQPDSISLSFVITPASTAISNDGSITLTVTGGTPQYTFNWTNLTNTQNDSNLVTGTYCVTVTDAAQCQDFGCYSVSFSTGIESTISANDFAAYINNGTLFVNAILKKATDCTLQLADISGKVIYTSATEPALALQKQVPVGKLASGCYIIRLITPQQTLNKKIVVTD